MSMTPCTRAAMDGVERDAERLLKQWNAILTEKNEKECQELRNKWFFESLPFLVALPDDIHCWCGHYEIAWPSIEPFYHMNKKRDGETLLVVEELWARMSKELAHCVFCVKRRHEGLQEYFNIVQDGESAARLSRIMDRLETERVAGVVKDMWTRIEQKQFMVQEFGFDNLVTVIYEVLSSPWLLDDAEIFYQFGKMLHYIHEEFSLELVDGSEYGGLFWLLFHNDSNVRLDAWHLIEKHEELKTTKDMEKIQPLLMKCMTLLERNQFSEEEVAISLSLKGRVSSVEGHTGPEEAGTSGSHTQPEEDSIRPKTSFKRVHVWTGICKILELAETRALEVGIVEQYVSFLSIVVDHVSEATAVLWNALRCLKILLEKLGCNFWEHSPYLPGLVRNSLLSQCFHWSEERIHNAIFDVFVPFIKSLEALQEGQIERQRRNLLFILLKQVPENKHFKMMNTRAKQIAFDIVRRGYSVQASFPGSSPPWDCANIWGPALLETVMSTSDTATIQQSALDLLQLMLIGDVSVLSALFIRNKASSKGQTPPNLAQEDEDEDGEEVRGSAGTGLGERPNVLSVNEFRRLQRSAVDEADRWRCVPIIWDFLRKVSPSAVPSGLAETVFWAASQFSPLEGGPPGEMERETICANGDLAERISVELRQAMSWANSTGVDDCDEVSCVNAMLAKHHWMQLIWILKRWAGMFVQRYRSIKVVNQPWAVEGLVLLFLDADTEMGAFRKEMMKAYAGGKEDKVALDDFFGKICSSPAASVLIARGFQHAAHMLLAQEFQYSVRRLAQFAFYVKKILESIISRKPTEASAWDHVVARICEISWQAIVEPLTTVSPCGMGKHNLDVQYAQLSFVNIFQLLQVIWQYLPRTGRNGPVTRTILREGHEYPHQDCRSIRTDVISKIIRWGLTRDLSVRRRWKGAIEVIMKDLLQHLDQLPPEILDAGKQVLEAGTSPLTDEERIALAPLFKNAAPGSLGRGLLENLPRVSGERVSISGSIPGGKVPISIGQKNGSVLNLNSVKSEPVSPEDSSSGKAALHVDSSCEMNGDQFNFKDALQSGSRVRGREVVENGDAADNKIAADQFNFKDALQSRSRLRGRGVAEDGDDTDKILADCLRSTSRLRARVEGLDKGDELTASAAVGVKEEPMGRESCPFTISNEGTRWSKPEWVEMEHGIVMIPDDDEDESKGQSAESDLETKTSEDSRASRQYLSGLKRPCSDADYANEHIGRSELSRPSTPGVSNASKGASRGGVASVRGDTIPGALPEGAPGNRLFGVPLDGAMGSQAGPAKRRKVETGKGVSKFAALRKDYHAERQKMNTTIAANKCRIGNASVAAVHSNQGFARDQAVLDGESRERYRPVLEETSHHGNKGTDGELVALRNILKSAGQGSRRKTIQLGTPGKVAGRGSSGTSTGRIGKSGQRPPPPRLDDWWKEILKLDYYEVIRVESDRDKDALRKAGLLRVQNRFVDSSDYQKTFAPLVLEEFKAQIQKEHMEGNGNASGRGAEPEGVLRLMSLEKVDDFWVGRFMGEPGSDAVLRSCFEHDLLHLVRQAGAGSGTPPHMLAKVEKRDRDSKMRGVILHLRFYLPAGNDRLVKAKSSLRDNSKWQTTKLLSLISNIREFQALSSIENLPFLDVILQPCPEHGQTVARELCLGALPQPLRERLEREYNESQLSAIAASIGPKPGAAEQGHHLALIQGPPGTGKTRTILAIVSALLALWAHNLEAQRNTSQNGCGGRGSDEGEPIKLGHWRRSGRGRVLVCAQSNAAVDELVARIFKCGLYGADGSQYKPQIVRVGNIKTVHPDSMPVFIDHLVSEEMGAVGPRDSAESQAEALKSRLGEILESIQAMESRQSLHDDPGNTEPCTGSASDEAAMGAANQSAKQGFSTAPELTDPSSSEFRCKLNQLYTKKKEICANLQAIEREERKVAEEKRIKTQALRKKIIRDAEVVVTTLSGCGGDVYAALMGDVGNQAATLKNRQQMAHAEDFFDAVVIDEAAQALEPATLIPLQLLGPLNTRCIMVGDPKQLPATVLSKAAASLNFERSLFERLQKSNYPVTMLSIQYRMHPEICRFPSSYFYGGQLVTGETVSISSRTAPFHERRCFGPYMFFDVVEGRERTSASQSIWNDAEIDLAIELFSTLQKWFPDEMRPGRVGVITMYRQQLQILRDRFARAFGQNIAQEVEFNTVDGFQGREVDILIVSTVRAHPQSSSREAFAGNPPGAEERRSIGFVADVRRMNVALTRPRFSLWILGHATTLQAGAPLWAALIEDARRRDCFLTAKRPYNCAFSASSWCTSGGAGRTVAGGSKAGEECLQRNGSFARVPRRGDGEGQRHHPKDAGGNTGDSGREEFDPTKWKSTTVDGGVAIGPSGAGKRSQCAAEEFSTEEPHRKARRKDNDRSASQRKGQDGSESDAREESGKAFDATLRHKETKERGEGSGNKEKGSNREQSTEGEKASKGCPKTSGHLRSPATCNTENDTESGRAIRDGVAEGGGQSGSGQCSPTWLDGVANSAPSRMRRGDDAGLEGPMQGGNVCRPTAHRGNEDSTVGAEQCQRGPTVGDGVRSRAEQVQTPSPMAGSAAQVDFILKKTGDATVGSGQVFEDSAGLGRQSGNLNPGCTHTAPMPSMCTPSVESNTRQRNRQEVEDMGILLGGVAKVLRASKPAPLAGCNPPMSISSSQRTTGPGKSFDPHSRDGRKKNDVAGQGNSKNPPGVNVGARVQGSSMPTSVCGGVNGPNVQSGTAIVGGSSAAGVARVTDRSVDGIVGGVERQKNQETSQRSAEPRGAGTNATSPRLQPGSAQGSNATTAPSKPVTKEVLERRKKMQQWSEKVKQTTQQRQQVDQTLLREGRRGIPQVGGKQQHPQPRRAQAEGVSSMANRPRPAHATANGVGATRPAANQPPRPSGQHRPPSHH